jgi:VanZ family protein
VRARRWALGWGILLLILTSWPKPPILPFVTETRDLDKLFHGVLYAVQAFLLYRAVRWPGRAGFSAGRVLTIVGAMAVWAVADEVHQVWIPGRSLEGRDVIADVGGAAAGAVLAAARRRLRRRVTGDR